MLDLSTVDHGRAMSAIRDAARTYAHRLAVIGVEVPLSKYAYNRPGANYRAMKKIAHNVGDCWRKAKSLAEFCSLIADDHGASVLEINPGKTKVSREAFQYLTGFPEDRPSSSHSRDAGMVAVRAYNTWKMGEMIDA